MASEQQISSNAFDELLTWVVTSQDQLRKCQCHAVCFSSSSLLLRSHVMLLPVMNQTAAILGAVLPNKPQRNAPMIHIALAPWSVQVMVGTRVVQVQTLSVRIADAALAAQSRLPAANQAPSTATWLELVAWPKKKRPPISELTCGERPVLATAKVNAVQSVKTIAMATVPVYQHQDPVLLTVASVSPKDLIPASFVRRVCPSILGPLAVLAPLLWMEKSVLDMVHVTVRVLRLVPANVPVPRALMSVSSVLPVPLLVLGKRVHLAPEFKMAKLVPATEHATGLEHLVVRESVRVLLVLMSLRIVPHVCRSIGVQVVSCVLVLLTQERLVRKLVQVMEYAMERVQREVRVNVCVRMGGKVMPARSCIVQKVVHTVHVKHWVRANLVVLKCVLIFL